LRREEERERKLNLTSHPNRHLKAEILFTGSLKFYIAHHYAEETRTKAFKSTSSENRHEESFKRNNESHKFLSKQILSAPQATPLRTITKIHPCSWFCNCIAPPRMYRCGVLSFSLRVIVAKKKYTTTLARHSHSSH
jgi:hypothetical protein